MSVLQTLLLSTAASLLIAFMRYRRLAVAIDAHRLTRVQAASSFASFAVVQGILGGTIYFWVLLILLPDHWLRNEMGHNSYGIPIAGLIVGGAAGALTSAVGSHLLSRPSRVNEGEP